MVSNLYKFSCQATHPKIPWKIIHSNRGVNENIIIIGDPSETDMPDWIPIGARHAWSEPHPIGDRYACGDPSETDIPVEFNRNLNTYSNIFKIKGFRSGMSLSDQACRSPTRHVALRAGISLSDQACRTAVSYVGLAPILIISSWTLITQYIPYYKIICWQRK